MNITSNEFMSAMREERDAVATEPDCTRRDPRRRTPNWIQMWW